MGKSKNKVSGSATTPHSNAKKTEFAPALTAFQKAAQAKAQRLLYRDIRLAERCILSPDDELYGIAIPSVN